MKCNECSGEYKILRDSIEINDDYVGKFKTDLIDYYKCISCGDILFPSKSAIIVEANRKKRLNDILQSKPIKDYISATETAKILNMSRQALHKHKRIGKGFIFNILFNGKKVFLKESVLLFKEKSDGRFPLFISGTIFKTSWTRFNLLTSSQCLLFLNHVGLDKGLQMTKDLNAIKIVDKDIHYLSGFKCNTSYEVGKYQMPTKAYL